MLLLLADKLGCGQTLHVTRLDLVDVTLYLHNSTLGAGTILVTMFAARRLSHLGM